MHRLRLTWALSAFATLAVATAAAQQNPLIDWQGLRNPVLSYPDWSIKDSAMAYRAGTFYIFFSAFYSERGQVRSHVVEVSTRDFKHYSQPIFNFDGEEDGWMGMCSPDVQRLRGKYVMTFNSWGDKPGKPNQLFYMTSDDLLHWTPRKTLGLNLTKIGNQRVIDAALAEADGGYYLVYKEQSPGIHSRPRIAFSTSLDAPFRYVDDGIGALLMKDGKDNGFFHENYELLQADGQWYLLTTDYLHNQVSPDKYDVQAPYLYALEAGSHWLKWTRGYTFDLPQEAFNQESIANAAALYDWQKYDGYYYVIYAGRNEGQLYAKRGWNQLGLARSKDLIHWSVPGSNH
ncbi:MAG TPA: family 43 glycosylhydrolase [Acidobacteriaceae bacterium]